jgi:Ca-activated chloride channel homolog
MTRSNALHPTALTCAAGAPALRMFLTVALCAAAPLVAATPDPSSAVPQVFRAHSDLVVLHVNVFDGRSDAVPDLPQDAFTVLEDGKPQQISFFNSADVPVSVGLVLDNSGSMIARQKMVVAGGVAFAKESHPEDQLFVVIFNENVRFGLPQSVAFTKNPLMVHGALSRFPPGGKTALHDAVVAAIDHLENAEHQKRVLIVLSDGEDNASLLSKDDMLAKAARSHTIIYTVSHRTAGLTGGDGNRRLLRKLADTSGGIAYFPGNDDDVVSAFEEIAQNIRRGYALGYVPTNTAHDGGFRRVIVRVRAPGHTNLKVRARDGYLASDHAGTR